MRTLEKAPPSAIDPATRSPRFGSYEGAIPGVDLRPLARNPLARIARHKHWFYASVATGELFVACAVVRLGYSAAAFAYLYDATAGRILAHESRIAPPTNASVHDDAAQGVRARFASRSASWSIAHAPGGAVAMDVTAGELTVRARLDAAQSPPGITAVARIPDGVVDVTHKRALLAASGVVELAGRRWSLDGGLGGFDVTQGLLARRTRWRWAFAPGRAVDGTPVALNLVQGFVGEPECALWVGGRLYPVGEGVIDFDRADPRAPWRVATRCGAIDLRFVPRDFHREDKNLLVASSRFVQAVGEYDGELRLPDGRALRVSRVLGVTEEQDTRW